MVYYNYISVIEYEYYSKSMFYKVQSKRIFHIIEYFSFSRWKKSCINSTS